MAICLNINNLLVGQQGCSFHMHGAFLKGTTARYSHFRPLDLNKTSISYNLFQSWKIWQCSLFLHVPVFRAVRLYLKALGNRLAQFIAVHLPILHCKQYPFLTAFWELDFILQSLLQTVSSFCAVLYNVSFNDIAFTSRGLPLYDRHSPGPLCGPFPALQLPEITHTHWS